jgi:cell division protein FtsW (lipid II flippase)
MSYLRFWWRTCLVFCPIVFVILYASGVVLTKVLLSVVGVAVGGLLLVLPFILVFSRVDRSMWSPEEHRKRQLRYKQKLREWEGRAEEEDEAGETDE